MDGFFADGVLDKLTLLLTSNPQEFSGDKLNDQHTACCVTSMDVKRSMPILGASLQRVR